MLKDSVLYEDICYLGTFHLMSLKKMSQSEEFHKISTP